MAKNMTKLVLQKCNTFKYYYIYLKNLKVILSKNANLSFCNLKFSGVLTVIPYFNAISCTGVRLTFLPLPARLGG